MPGWKSGSSNHFSWFWQRRLKEDKSRSWHLVFQATQALNPFPDSFLCSLKTFFTHLMSSVISSSRSLSHLTRQPKMETRSHLHHHFSESWKSPKSWLPSEFNVPTALELYWDSPSTKQSPWSNPRSKYWPSFKNPHKRKKKTYNRWFVEGENNLWKWMQARKFQSV